MGRLHQRKSRPRFDFERNESDFRDLEPGWGGSQEYDDEGYEEAPPRGIKGRVKAWARRHKKRIIWISVVSVSVIAITVVMIAKAHSGQTASTNEVSQATQAIADSLAESPESMGNGDRSETRKSREARLLREYEQVMRDAEANAAKYKRIFMSGGAGENGQGGSRPDLSQEEELMGEDFSHDTGFVQSFMDPRTLDKKKAGMIALGKELNEQAKYLRHEIQKLQADKK